MLNPKRQKILCNIFSTISDGFSRNSSTWVLPHKRGLDIARRAPEAMFWYGPFFHRFQWRWHENAWNIFPHMKPHLCTVEILVLLKCLIDVYVYSIRWGFLKWGYPKSSQILHFILVVFVINHPAIGVPPFQEYIYIYIICVNYSDLTVTSP